MMRFTRGAAAAIVAVFMAAAFPVSADAPRDGLVAHWRFDEKSGDTVSDSVGTFEPGRLLNGPVWTSGVHGSALMFDGENAVVELGGPDAANFSGPITIAAWVGCDAIDQHRIVVMHKERTRPGASTYLKLLNNAYAGGVWTGTAAVHVQSPAKADHRNKWQHLAVTHDGKSWRLFRNGKPVASRSDGQGARRFSGNWYLGGLAGEGISFKGVIDEVRLYNRALSPDEIQQVVADAPIAPGAPVAPLPPLDPPPVLAVAPAEPWLVDRLAYHGQLIDAYRAITKDPPAAKEMAVVFMKAAHYRAVVDPPALTWHDVRALGDRAAQLGAADPLVACYRVWAEWGSNGNLDAAQPRLEKAWPRLKQLGYPAEARLMFGWLGVDMYNSRRLMTSKDKQAPGKLIAQLDGVVVETLQSELFEPRFRSATFQHIRSLVGTLERNDKHAIRMRDKVAASKGGDPWLRHMTLARLESKIGWQARGGGFARTVTDEGGNVFRQKMNKAAKHYTQAWRLQPDLPEPAAAMIDVAKAGGGNESPRVWFDRAIKARFDYPPAYAIYTAALRPRWGGSYPRMEEFANECYESGRFDTNVPYRYLEVIDAIARDARSTNAPDDWKHPWRDRKRYDRGVEILTKLADDPKRTGDGILEPTRDRLLSELALIAIRAKDYTTARRTIQRLGDRLDTAAFRSDFRHPEYEIARAYAFGGPHGAKFRGVWDFVDADQPMTDAAIESALTTLDEIRAETRDQRERAYERYLWQRIEQQQDWNLGAWVDIPFDKDLLMWQPAFGTWEAQSDGSVIGTHPKDISRMSLFPRFGYKVKPPFEAVVTIEPVGRRLPRDKGFQAGIAVGELRPFPGRPATGRVFFADPHLDDFGVVLRQRGWTKEPIPRSDSIRLHVVILGDERVEFAANGVRSRYTAVTGYSPFMRDDVALNLGTMLFHHSNGAVRFRDFRLRRITTPTVAADATHEQDLRYYIARLNENPVSPVAQSLVGWSYHRLGRVEELEKHYRRTLETNPSDVSVASYHADQLELDGRFAEALAVLREADKRVPRHYHLQIKLAWMLASCPIDELRDGAEALRVADRALANTGSFEAMTTRAVALAELERFGDAKKQLEAMSKEIRRRYRKSPDELKRQLDRSRYVRKVINAGQPYRDEGTLLKLGLVHLDGRGVPRNVDRALAYFEAALKLEPINHAALRIWMCRGLLGEQERGVAFLAEYRKANKLEGWVADLSRFLEGEIDADRLLTLAAKGDAQQKKERASEAYFWIGAKHLVENRRKAAISSFTKCKHAGVAYFFEHRSAVAELRRLGAPQ